MLSFNEIQDPTDPRVKRILKAGLENFQKHGFRKASIDEICARAEFSKPTFYKFFQTKQELFFGVRVYLGGKLRSSFFDACQSCSSSSEKLLTYFRMLDDFSRSKQSLTEILDYNRELRKGWNRHPWSKDGYQSSLDIIEGIVTEGIAADEFRAENPTLLAHKVVISVTMLGILRRNPPRYIKSSDSAPDLVFDLLMNGIKKIIPHICSLLP